MSLHDRSNCKGIIMCKWGNDILVKVKIPADLSHTGKAYWTKKGIDKCIAPIVKALVSAAIYTAGSCCGHGENNGYIALHDKRVLIIKDIEGSLACTVQET